MPMQTNRLMRHRILHIFKMSLECSASNFVDEFTQFYNCTNIDCSAKFGTWAECKSRNGNIRSTFSFTKILSIVTNKYTGPSLLAAYTPPNSLPCTQIDSPKDIQLPESESGANVCCHFIHYFARCWKPCSGKMKLTEINMLRRRFILHRQKSHACAKRHLQNVQVH